MELYILRHGIAVERGTEGFENDFDRPLTSLGRQKLKRVIGACRELDLCFDLILSSPYVRARQTAQQVARALHLEKQLQFEGDLGAETTPRQVVKAIACLQPMPNRLLIVGHEPSLSSTISLLMSGSQRPCLLLKKAGLAKLAVKAIRPGRCAELEWLLTPAQTSRMS